MKPNNLSTFKILFLVKGILSFFLSIIPLIYAFVGAFISNQIDRFNPTIPFNPGSIFLVIGSVGFVILIIFGILALIVSSKIGQTKNYNFIFVSSIILGLTGILGVLLCIFTLIELSKPEIKALFERNKDKDDLTLITK